MIEVVSRLGTRIKTDLHEEAIYPCGPIPTSWRFRSGAVLSERRYIGRLESRVVQSLLTLTLTEPDVRLSSPRGELFQTGNPDLVQAILQDV